LRQPGTFAGRLRTPASQKDIFQMTIKDNVHAALPSGRTPPISAQNLRDAIDLVIDYVPTVAGTGGGGGSVVTGAAATFDTLATLQAATVDAGINYVRTAGYYAVGDGGGAAYRRKAAGEADYELDRTSNGGTVKWELIPERMEIWLKQAGAKGPSGFNTQDNDCYPAFRAIDKFAKAKGLSGYSLRIDSGLYYSSKAWQFKRITTKVIGTANGSSGGGGTCLRFPSDQCGLITNYKWGMGHDYMMALGNWNFEDPLPSWRGGAVGRGICVYSGANGGVPDGSVYRVVAPGTSPSNGAAAIVSTTPNVDIPWGTMKIRYEGNLITDSVPGGGTMDYDCGADDNHSAGGCLFENLQLWGYFDGYTANNWKWKHNNAGIAMRIRGHISNCFTLGFAGAGIAVIADGDWELGGPGNANGTYVEHCASYWNGKDGVHFGSSNANCIVAICIDVSSNGRWGIADWGFLGNSITGVESAYDGRAFAGARQYYPQCQYQGWIYMARLPSLGAGDQFPAYINENPTSNSTAWIKYYKTGNEDFVNAEQHVTGTTGSAGWITLGTANTGKQTFTAAGVASGAGIWCKLTDGANYEVFYATFVPGSPDVLQRGPKTKAKDAGGIIASSAALDANGIYQPLTLTGSAIVKALCVGENPSEIAAWTPEVQFEPAGAYSTITIAARSVWQYIYIEGGTLPAQWCWPTLVLGGMLNGSYDKTRGVIAIEDGKWTSLGVTSNAIMADNSWATQFVYVGSGNTILDWTTFTNQRWNMRMNSLTGNDFIMENAVIGQSQFNPVFRVRGGGSASLYGRSSDGDWSGGNAPMQITNLIVGDGSGGGGRLVQMGPGAPTSGYHAKGEFVLNDGTGADNTTFLWRCTAAGTPGTWVART
jgi:hypothetical protein